MIDTPQVSVIIVYYRVKKELLKCIYSLLESKTNLSFEIIVVDNDRNKIIEQEITKHFPEIKYIKSRTNIGYGAGNNLGASRAKGKYLFFLNPDTKVYKNSIDILCHFLSRDKKVGIVAPLLLDIKQNPYPLQGSQELTPLRAIVSLSFLNKFFPNNPISKAYWLLGWNKKHAKKVDVVPGTAFLIRRSVFEDVGGFDEKFFLYFEENDLCKRVRQLGFDIYINPESKIVHLLGKSTKTRKDIRDIFLRSRFLYFRKHFGFTSAFLVHNLLNIRKIHIFLGVVLFLSAFLRFFKLSELMPFIGDQGWFYLSARDMILTGEIPLLGITSSHTWLHQGPLWTYILAVVLFAFNFNPVSPAYFVALLGVLTVFLIYKIGKNLFSQRVGLIAAFLYASSPLVVIHSRIPYHTTPIPFFTLLFIFVLYKWTMGNTSYFPLVILLLVILYNFELATSVLWFVLFIVLGYGIFRKKAWLTGIFKKNILLLSLLALITPMLPVLLYDILHGFAQTIKFSAWILYRAASFFGYLNTYTISLDKLLEMIDYFAIYYNRLIFIASKPITLLIFISSFIWLGREICYNAIKSRAAKSAYAVLLLCIFIPFLGFMINQTPSEAYLPVFFPSAILLTALFFEQLLGNRVLSTFGFAILLFVVFANSIFLLSQNYLMKRSGGYGPTFKDRLKIAEKIVKMANDKKYNLIGRGTGSEFKSFTMNYEYLTWWLGNSPSKKSESLQFVIRETPEGIKLKTH